MVYITLICALLSLAPLQILTITFSCTYAIKRTSLSTLIWVAFFSGLAIDLFASHTLIGTATLITLTASLIVKRLNRYFFFDSILSFGVSAFFFSLIYTALTFIALKFYNQPLTLTFQVGVSEFIVSPFLDALFATACYAIIQGVKKWMPTQAA